VEEAKKGANPEVGWADPAKSGEIRHWGKKRKVNTEVLWGGYREGKRDLGETTTSETGRGGSLGGRYSAPSRAGGDE